AAAPDAFENLITANLRGAVRRGRRSRSSGRWRRLRNQYGRVPLWRSGRWRRREDSCRLVHRKRCAIGSTAVARSFLGHDRNCWKLVSRAPSYPGTSGKTSNYMRIDGPYPGPSTDISAKPCNYRKKRAARAGRTPESGNAERGVRNTGIAESGVQHSKFQIPNSKFLVAPIQSSSSSDLQRHGGHVVVGGCV